MLYIAGTFLQLTDSTAQCTQCRSDRSDRLGGQGEGEARLGQGEDRMGRDEHLPLEDKENIGPEALYSPPFTPTISRTQSLRRRCSNYFTPKSKRPAGSMRERAASIRLPSSSRKLGLARRPSLSLGSGSPSVAEPGRQAGAGRLIPVKQGYMYKRSGASRLYRRKYVTLCGEGVLSYWPSFQAYVDNVEGKEIQLGHVTVKVPGRPPAGVRTAEEEEERGTGDLELEELEEEREEGVELVLVSLDSSTWYFQVCSPREVKQWEEAIQGQILASLTRREVRPDLERLRALPGNRECADCGAVDPDWASINLGILVCIECSGIHRNLGSHVSKVRSLSLDTWSPGMVAALERTGGNSLANQLWEARLHRQDNRKRLVGGGLRQGQGRLEKEEFIRAKYLLRAFCSPQAAASHGVLI